MPPPVEPAQAPMNIISSSTKREASGQRSKSAVQKPVVVMTDVPVKKASRKQRPREAAPAAQALNVRKRPPPSSSKA